MRSRKFLRQVDEILDQIPDQDLLRLPDELVRRLAEIERKPKNYASIAIPHQKHIRCDRLIWYQNWEKNKIAPE